MSRYRSTVKTYQETLSKLGYGIPLWIPEPTNDEVLIGDVGFFDEYGSWCRMFNILHAETDAQVNRQGVPSGFEPLSPDTYELKRIPRIIRAGVHFTQSVRKTSIQVAGHAER